MARCGCGAGGEFVLDCRDGLECSGSGTITRPKVISVVKDAAMCRIVTECVCEGAGQGLTCDTLGRPSVQISAATGNKAQIGPDGGIYVPDGSLPPEQLCKVTVDGLLKRNDVVGGLMGGASLILPYASKAAMDYALAHQLDVVDCTTKALADNVAAWVPFDDKYAQPQNTDPWTWTNDYRDYTSLGANYPLNQVSSERWRTTTSFCGNPWDPRARVPGGNYSTITVGSITRDVPSIHDEGLGGWYGYHAAREEMWCAPEVLRRVDGKLIVSFGCRDDRDVRAAARAVLEYCAQDWTLIQLHPHRFVVNTAASTPDAAKTLANFQKAARAAKEAGLRLACVVVNQQNLMDIITPGVMKDAGVEIVYVQKDVPVAMGKPYTDAGLFGLLCGALRHSDRPQVTAMGCKGALCHDPVYFRANVSEYWRSVDEFDTQARQTGHLSFYTDGAIGVYNPTTCLGGGWVEDGGKVHGGQGNGYFVPGPTAPGRGYYPDVCLYLPARFGRYRDSPSVLAGWLCPPPDPSKWTLFWYMKTESQAPTDKAAKLGLFFRCPTDISVCEPDDTVGVYAQRAGYVAFVRVNRGTSQGEIVLGKWVPGSDPSQKPTYTQLAANACDRTEVLRPGTRQEGFERYSLQIDGDKITFTRWNGLKDTDKSWSVTATDSAFKGNYIHMIKEELGSQGVFVGGFGGFSYGQAKSLSPELQDQKLARTVSDDEDRGPSDVDPGESTDDTPPDGTA